MNCPNCGRKIADTMPICPFCGQKIGLLDAGSEQMHSSAARLFNRQANDKKTEEKKEEPKKVIQEAKKEVESPKSPENKGNHSPTLKVDGLKKEEPTKSPVAKSADEMSEPKKIDEDTAATPLTEQEENGEDIDVTNDEVSSEINNDFNPNADGYYDDVVPAMAEQINKLPVENMMRIGIIVATLVVIGIILFIAK